MSDSFRELAAELRTIFARGVDEPLGEADFNALALRVFRFQARTNEVYGRFVAGRGVEPGAVEDWREIPTVPTSAFKHLRLLSVPGPAAGPVPEGMLLFRTSGTREGRERRGEHVVPDPGLYRAALLPAFRAHLLPDGARLPLLALLPSPEQAPDSSLSTMVATVMEEVGAQGCGWFVDVEEGLRVEALTEALMAARARGEPVLLAGTAFSFVHLMDALDARGLRLRLPPGSRLMETGGFKGRSRTLARHRLYAGLAERLGIPPGRMVNEYGMTELLSQFYEPVLPDAPGAPPAPALDAPEAGPWPGPEVEATLARRWLQGPPWVRTRVLDPETLAEAQEGRPGILAHLDLANLGSVAAVLTEDVGVGAGPGFRVLGRTPGAEPRGCSRALDELLGRPRG